MLRPQLQTGHYHYHHHHHHYHHHYNHLNEWIFCRHLNICLVILKWTKTDPGLELTHWLVCLIQLYLLPDLRHKSDNIIDPN